jgi:predicted homoserine dehydrogenase-like protein
MIQHRDGASAPDDSSVPLSGAPVRVAVTGARGGYGRTLLAQLRHVSDQTAAVLIDPDTAGVRQMLLELGCTEDGMTVTDDRAAAEAAVHAGRIALVPGAEALPWNSVDVLVEATGRVDVGTAYATRAIEHGVHVVMVSKETETVAGIAHHRRAAAAGVSYLPGDGDQPANLLRLLDWIERVGLEVVACGKSSEYDLVLDPATGRVRQLDVEINAPSLAELLELGDDAAATLAARAEAVTGLKRSAAADSCEMAVVSQYSGYLADTESMHYPVARPDELADIYAEGERGGLIAEPGAVDVFSMLRLPGEASFAGGVFAVVRTGDPVTWELLRSKGHVVSRDGSHACIYWPYHAMGVETPLTIAAATGRGAVAPQIPRTPAPHTLLAARASRHLASGTRLAVEGHHHEVAGVAPVMLPGSEARRGAAAYYLLGGATLRRDIAAGELIGLDDLDGVAPVALDAFADGFLRP